MDLLDHQSVCVCVCVDLDFAVHMSFDDCHQTHTIAQRALQIVMRHNPTCWVDFVTVCYDSDEIVAHRWFLALAQSWLESPGLIPLPTLVHLVIFKACWRLWSCVCCDVIPVVVSRHCRAACRSMCAH